MIKEAYCSFEVCKLLKEKGFDEGCIANYIIGALTPKLSINTYGLVHNNTDFLTYSNIQYIAAPTHQMAMRWLREKGIYICPKHCCFCGSKPKDKPYYLWEPRILRLPGNNIIYPQPVDMCDHYDSYEEAVESALLYVLKNLI